MVLSYWGTVMGSQNIMSSSSSAADPQVLPALNDRNDDHVQSSNRSRRLYISRRSSSKIPDLAIPKHYVGGNSWWSILWGSFQLVIPISYLCVFVFIVGAVATRDHHVWQHFLRPTLVPLEECLSFGFRLTGFVSLAWRTIECWCLLEVVFHLLIQIKLQWLQSLDPLEASLRAARWLNLNERALLWNRMMDSDAQDPISFVTGWFFHCSLECISRYDICDFLTWFMFETRHQEHLTNEELQQLEQFVQHLEHRIGLQLYGSRNVPSDMSNEHSREARFTCCDDVSDRAPKVEPRNSTLQCHFRLSVTRSLEILTCCMCH